MPMPQKPSIRNIIATAQDYLTFVETCPPYAQQQAVAQNTQTIVAAIEAYNTGIDGGLGQGFGQMKFEDEHAKKIMDTLKGARTEIQKATQNPQLKNFVADGGGPEMMRMNPVKLTNFLTGLQRAELEGVGRAASTYHNHGSKKYEAHGNTAKLQVADPVTKLLSYPKPAVPPGGAMKR